MFTEITVITKDESKTTRQKFPSYQDTDGIIALSHSCDKLKAMVEEARANFIGEPDEIIVKATYTW